MNFARIKMTMFCTICNTNSATIGEKSRPPNGGIIRLNKFKYISVISRIVLNGWFSHLILGIQLKNILNIIKKKYKLNMLLIPFAIPSILPPIIENVF